jgi:phosphotransferase system enzyme I (PtsP)
VVERCDAAGVPVSLCGEAAGRPIEAMALIGLGLRSISMTAAAVGPVKMMVRSLNLEALEAFMARLYDLPDHSCRAQLEGFASDHGVVI